MQILQCFFKVTHEEETKQTSTSLNNKQQPLGAKNQGIDTNTRSVDKQSELGCRKNSIIFTILRRREIAKTYFYSTPNLKRDKKLNRRKDWTHSMGMKKEDFARGLGISQKADSSTAHAGNKVLPISETMPSSSVTSTNDQCGQSEKKERPKGDKNRTISRMKELLGWAAAAKSEKGGKYISRKVLYFRNRGTLKAVPDDDELSIDSPKISFRWDLESCSTTSSAYSAFSMASSSKNYQALDKVSVDSTAIQDIEFKCTKTGNWITTDSDFVVLEL